jgi:hypothetical protein
MASWWLRGRPSGAGLDPAEAAIVSTKSGQTLKGVAVVISAEGMVLTAARLGGIGKNGEVTWSPMAGEVVVPADNIDYWQRGIGMEEVG